MDHEKIVEAKKRFEKVLEVVKGDIDTIRTGRAKPSLLENVSVEAYGSRMKLMEVASITAPDPTMILVTPWDKTLMKAVEKAIYESELQLTPANAGDVIRVPIPSLTEERRLDFVKLLKQKLESGKQMMRQQRQDVKEEIEKMKGQAGVSEDLIESLLGELDKKTEEYIGKLEQMAGEKEEEILAL